MVDASRAGRTPDVELRRATPEDALAMAVAQIACWREAYTGIVPQSFLDQIDVDVWADRRGTAAWGGDRGRCCKLVGA